jgi:rhomboid family GlyGly-CTERM serine protease
MSAMAGKSAALNKAAQTFTRENRISVRSSPMSIAAKHIARNLPFYLILLVTGTLSLLGEDATRLLRYDRVDLLSGDYYRLLSGHFVHLGGSHALMNLAAVAILWFWFREVLTTGGWGFSILACALLISLMLLMFSDVPWYVGLSGVLHGMLLLGTARKKDFTPWIKWLVLAALLLKIGVEQFHGPSSKTVAFIHGEVVVDAHLYGAISGALIWYALKRKNPGPSHLTDPG